MVILLNHKEKFVQLDIFGNEHEIENITQKASRKFKTMQQIYGVKQGTKCKNCKHFIRHNYNNKTYFKCGLWRISSSSATDIRANQEGCNKYD